MRHAPLFMLLGLAVRCPGLSLTDSDGPDPPYGYHYPDFPYTYATPVTVHELHEGVVPEGRDVLLEGAVVTSPVARNGEGFFVQDQGGGAQSGIFVRLNFGNVEIGVGDLVDVQGHYDPVGGRRQISVHRDDVRVVGEAEVTVDEIPCDDSASLSDWRGGLISIQGVEIGEYAYYGEYETRCGMMLGDLFIHLDNEEHWRCERVTGPLYVDQHVDKIEPRFALDLEDCLPGCRHSDIDDLNQDGFEEGETICLDEVAAVTAWQPGEAGLYVQDQGGGSYGGLYLAHASGDSAIARGALLDVEGSIEGSGEFPVLSVETLTELGTTGPEEAEGLDAAPQAWEPWVSALVTLEGAEILELSDTLATSFGIAVDATHFDPQPEAGWVYGEITGVVSPDGAEWLLTPRDAGDIVN